MRRALARELCAAALRGDQTADKAQVVDSLHPTWTGTSSEELLATARVILTDDSSAP